MPNKPYTLEYWSGHGWELYGEYVSASAALDAFEAEQESQGVALNRENWAIRGDWSATWARVDVIASN